MPAPARLAPHAHAWATAALAAGFALAALASLTTFFAIHAIVDAQATMGDGPAPDTHYVGGILNLSMLASEGAFLLMLIGAFGLLVALAIDWRAPHARRALLVAPALLVGALLMDRLLSEYLGAFGAAKPTDKVPFLLGMGCVLAVLVSTSRASMPLVSAGTAALVAGAVQASARGAYSPMLGLSLPPLAWENAWGALGFALLAVALAAHSHRMDRMANATQRAEGATEPAGQTA